jgi:hypothetical protein
LFFTGIAAADVTMPVAVLYEGRTTRPARSNGLISDGFGGGSGSAAGFGDLAFFDGKAGPARPRRRTFVGLLTFRLGFACRFLPLAFWEEFVILNRSYI